MKHSWCWLLVLGAAGGCGGTKSRQEPSAVPVDSSPQAFEVVPLKHAAATDIVSTLYELMDASRWAIAHRNSCRGPKLDTWSERYRSDRGREGLPWKIVADARTNSLVVSCSNPADLPCLRELILQLDVEAHHPCLQYE